MPSMSSEAYLPTVWDWALLAGTFGLFLVPLLLFIRFVPMVSAMEVKQVLHRYRGGEDG